jgi:hypothetical protein
MPQLPGAGRWLSMVSARTSRTEVEERFPTSCRLRQVTSRAPSGSSSDSCRASSTLGPPGWQTHEEMSARVRPWSARKASTSRRRKSRTTWGTSAESTMPKPLSEMLQPMTSSESG